MYNRATSIPRRFQASCPFRRMAKHAALLLIAATFVGAAPTKEAVIASYKHKFEYLKTWKIEYELFLRSFAPTGKKMETHDLIEHGGKDKRFYIKRKVIGSTEDARSDFSSKAVCNGTYYKRLDLWEENNRVETANGVIRKLKAPEAASDMCVQPLGYLGLMNQHWEDHWWLSPGADNYDLTVALRKEYARILPDSVPMDGYECYVLEMGQEGQPSERCWLAAKLGLAIIRKENYRYSKSGEASTTLTITASEFSEKVPGLFLPTRVRIQSGSLLDAPPKSGSGLPPADNEYLLHSVELNPDLPEELFELDFPDGTWVSDKIRGHAYAVPELQTTAASVLSSVANGLHSLVQGMTSNGGKGQQPGSSAGAAFWQSRVVFAILCFTVAVLVVVAATLIRIRRKRRSYREPIGS